MELLQYRDTMTKRTDIDWASIELEYRAGIKSLRTIGSQFGLTDAAIIKRAKRDSWERDLKARIQAATEAKLAVKVVSPEVSAALKVSEQKIVDANSDTQVDIILSTRTDIQRVLNLVYNLLTEMEETTNNRELFSQLGELMHAPDEKGVDKLNGIYLKSVSMPSRVSAMKSLTESLKTLIGLKRQAYGLSDNANGDSDKAVEKTEMSVQEEARRIAFVLASAMHNKGDAA
jgi:hypothetical protein